MRQIYREVHSKQRDRTQGQRYMTDGYTVCTVHRYIIAKDLQRKIIDRTHRQRSCRAMVKEEHINMQRKRRKKKKGKISRSNYKNSETLQGSRHTDRIWCRAS